MNVAPGRSGEPSGPRTVPRVQALAGAVPEFVVEIGGMLDLAGRVIVAAVRRPFSWGPEFGAQFSFTIRICFFPLILTAFALAFGPVGVQGQASWVCSARMTGLARSTRSSKCGCSRRW